VKNAFLAVVLCLWGIGAEGKWVKKQVPVYKTEDVYANKCTYDTHRWTYTETRVEEGNLSNLASDPVIWPKTDDIGPLQRALRRPGEYTLSFSYSRDGRQETASADVSPEVFSQWKPNDDAKLTILKRFGTLKRFEHVTPEATSSSK
jgi:hypothetical protein